MHYAMGSICSRTPFLPDSYPFVLIGRLPDQRAVRHKPGGRRARSEKKRRRARISACEDGCGPIVSQADRAQENRKWQGRIQSTSAAATMTSAQQSTHRMAPLTKVFFLERNRTLSSLIRLGLRIIPRSLSFETYLDRNYIPDRKIFPCVLFGLCECAFPHLFKKFSKFF